jgi:hypothetical protein
MDTLLLRLDESVTGLFGQWNLWTSAIFTVLAGFLTYQLTTRQDPDTHPFLLARQAQGSPVRQPGESPVYRSQGAPHGMPLNASLNVKDPGASKWSRGRDGDLRDIWRQAVAGVQEDGPTKGATGRILTVLGTDKTIEHKLADITRQINLIGQHIIDQGGNRVAIYLPNSVELIATLFACAFYDLTAVILPFDEPTDAIISMLRRSAADTVVTAPGSFPFDMVVGSYPSLRQLIWVVDEGSKHLDWNEVPQGTGGSVNVATWQDIVNDAPVNAFTELPPVDTENAPKDVVTFWQSKPGQMEEMVRFSQANLVSGISGQIGNIPVKEKVGKADVFLPADSLANIHTLTLTLAALFSHASVALKSVAGNSPDLVLATQGVSPTILVASPGSLLDMHKECMGKLGSALAKASHYLSTRSLAQDGVLSFSHPLSAFSTAARPTIGTMPGKLRLIYVADRAGADSPLLSTKVLSDMRIFTGAKIVYALTAPRVAGAVSQTVIYDYRIDDNDKSHFGAPLTSTEVFLKDKGSYKTTDDKIEGEIFVRGPCVSGGEAGLGVVGQIRNDNTLAYV